MPYWLLMYGQYLAVLVGIHTLGYVCTKILRIHFANQFFAWLAYNSFGIVASTIVFALFQTQGQSILVLLLPLIALFYFHQRTEPPTTTLFSWKKTGEMLLAATCIYAVRVFLLWRTDSTLAALPHSDYILYAKLSDYLTALGKENFYLDYFQVQKTAFYPSPYHYFEVWFNACLTFLIGGKTILNLNILTFSLLTYWIYQILSACFYAIYPKNNNGWIWILIVLSLFFNAFYLSIFQNIYLLNYTDSLATNLWTIPKLLIVYVFVGLALLFFLQKQPTLGLFALLALPIVYIPTAPAIFMATFLWVGIDFYFYKATLQKSLYHILVIITMAFFLALFYFFIPKAEVSNTLITLDRAYLLTFVKIMIGTTIQISIIYFPVLILLFLYFNTIKKWFIEQSAFWLVPLIYVGSLGTWAVLQKELDASQLFYNTSTPLIHCCALILFFYFLFKSHYLWWVRGGFLLLIMIGIWQTQASRQRNRYFEVAFLEEVQATMKDIKNPIGVFLKGKKDYQSPFNSSVGGMAHYLTLFANGTHTIALSVFEIPYQNPPEPKYALAYEKALKESLFYEYVMEQQKEKKFKNIAQSQLDFIDQYNIEYIALSPHASLNEALRKRVKKEIVDKNTGEKFYVIKHY